MPSSQKTILVTGCSKGGLGASLAIALAQQGHHVFATARNTAKIPPELVRLTGVTPLELDVTSTESVAAAAKIVSDATKHQENYGLDVLINNAGRGYTIPILDADLEEAKQVYDTNVWGTIRTTQAFADLVIAKKGRIVNISSMSAVVNTPWMGTYASSKAALTSISDTLRLELSPFGVSVVTIMLGMVATPFHDNQPQPVLRPTSRYASILNTITRWSKGEAGPEGSSVDDVAKTLLPDILDGGKNGVIWKGDQSGIVKFISRWLPTCILDGLIGQGQGLDELSRTLKK
ncbi:Short-chain dehydrogenase cctT [Cladobotryum mycophilum]|uniref:Short-chain dehydrogenase cctT n=1 Tax=Cladobotryum mycophilum TaxID=491253 RepID=A0ABR0SQ50_9HYPO